MGDESLSLKVTPYSEVEPALRTTYMDSAVRLQLLSTSSA